MSTETVVIIIPTYNEGLAIEETIRQVFQATAAITDAEIHVLIFDSHSTDDTQTVVRKLQKTYVRLHLKTEPEKSGLGSAYMQAIRHALTNLSADIVMEFDADLSHQPKYIAPMLEHMKNHDVVVGSRYVSGGSIPNNWGWHRKLLSKLGNLLARVILTPKYKDFTSGFRATHRRVLEKSLPIRFLSNQYAYKLHLFWSLHQNKARIHEHPIAFVDREKGQSKLPANSILDSLWVLLILRLRTLKRYFGMCLVGLTGMLLQLIVYNVLRHSLPPYSAAQYAVLLAVINNFILNSRFVFKKQAKIALAQRIKALVFYLGYSLLMIGFQSNWLQLGITYLGSGYVKENLIMVAGIVVGSLLNYLIYSRVVFRDKKPTVPMQEF